MFTYPVAHLSGREPPKCELLHSVGVGYNLMTWTIPSVPLGDASADRLIVVCFHGFRNTANSVAGVTINGVAATMLASDTTPVIQMYTAGALVPAGTVGDIVISFAVTNHYILGVKVYSVKGLTSNAPYIAQSYSSTSATLATVEANSIVLAHAISYDTSAASITWAGLNENSDANTMSRVNHSSASKLVTETQSNYAVGFTPSGGVHEQRMQIIGFK